jgi:GDP-D-mannose dehydratase
MRRFIGKEHCCAEITKVDHFFASKKIPEDCDKIIELIDRITLQLAELYFSFKNVKNTRVIYLPKNMTLLFHYYDGYFYVSSPEAFLPETIQITNIIRSIKQNTPLEIYGDGTQSRVFCHVQDAVKAILTLAATDSAIGEVYNIGGVGETTIKQLADKIIERTKSTSTITFTPYDDAYPAGYEDMQRRVPDTTKIKDSIGWSPANTLDNIIDDVAAEMKK